MIIQKNEQKNDHHYNMKENQTADTMVNECKEVHEWTKMIEALVTATQEEMQKGKEAKK